MMTTQVDVETLFLAIGAGLGVTIVMTVVSFVAGTLIAIPVALLRTSKAWLLRAPAVAFIDITRGIPPLVWLLIIYYGLSPILPLQPLPAAIIGLTLISGGYLAENLRAGIDNVNIAQMNVVR
jgi:polar amino acid transport system permease protein